MTIVWGMEESYMQRLMIIIALLLLIIFVVISYFILTDEGNRILFMIDGDILIPAGVMEKMNQGKTMELLKPTSWVFFGIFVLLYLKILWKLISFTWKNKVSNRIVKQKLRQRIY